MLKLWLKWVTCGLKMLEMLLQRFKIQTSLEVLRWRECSTPLGAVVQSHSFEHIGLGVSDI